MVQSNKPDDMGAYYAELCSLPPPHERKQLITKVVIEPNPFGHDTSWMTQEIIVAYAAACLCSDREANEKGLMLCGFDSFKFETLRSSLSDYNGSFVELKSELLRDYGKDYFRPLPTTEMLIRDLYQRMREVKDAKLYMTMYKELQKLQGNA